MEWPKTKNTKLPWTQSRRRPRRRRRKKTQATEHYEGALTLRLKGFLLIM